MVSRSVVAAVLLVLALPAGAGDKLAMRVSPHYAYAPANLTIHVSIEPDLENRAIHVSADSPTFYRSSVVELDGPRAPRTTVFRYRGVPAGRYEVRGVLIGTHGEERAMVRQVVTVLTAGGR